MLLKFLCRDLIATGLLLNLLRFPAPLDYMDLLSLSLSLLKTVKILSQTGHGHPFQISTYLSLIKIPLRSKLHNHASRYSDVT